VLAAVFKALVLTFALLALGTLVLVAPVLLWILITFVWKSMAALVLIVVWKALALILPLPELATLARAAPVRHYPMGFALTLTAVLA